MLQHPELIFWKKCPCCGYCELDEKAKAKMPNANKFTTYAHLFGYSMITEHDSATSLHKE